MADSKPAWHPVRPGHLVVIAEPLTDALEHNLSVTESTTTNMPGVTAGAFDLQDANRPVAPGTHSLIESTP